MTGSAAVVWLAVGLGCVIVCGGGAAWYQHQLHRNDCRTSTVTVEGNSMAPMIADGTNITIVSGGPQCAEPLARHAVVVVRNARHRLPLLKSLRGLPGDGFHLDGGHLFVNSAVVKNSAGQVYDFANTGFAMFAVYAQDYAATIPADTYLVLGDDAHGSLDSSQLGLVAREDIIGRRVD